MTYRSELMQCLRDKLGIQAKFSAPFHFQSHGMIEGLNANTEKILKTFVHENPRYWDKMIPYVHMALRENPHSATKFSLFQLVFGHQM